MFRGAAGQFPNGEWYERRRPKGNHLYSGSERNAASAFITRNKRQFKQLGGETRCKIVPPPPVAGRQNGKSRRLHQTQRGSAFFESLRRRVAFFAIRFPRNQYRFRNTQVARREQFRRT